MSGQQDTLPGLEHAATGRAGYLQRAVAAAVDAASLDDRDKGMGALAEACGRAIDLAQGRGDVYAVTAAARELRETLVRLRLDPTSRLGNDAGQVEQFLAGLGATNPDEARATP